MSEDNTFNYESAMAQLKQLPDLYKEAATICMNECRYAVVTLSDKCVAAYEVAKCIYFCNPDKYFMP
ncbi:hypothetical protein NQ314_020013 [Rhamnusium bicolor]|uniref:Uncharacterized protein n=1 Tax=Rhamnusium bicolor TaxID=1586634 RepID=A0AAV8WMU7_9CUCU|nr:hypothetical protein NQ314_020013 [Rhamnusium bicolor]